MKWIAGKATIPYKIIVPKWHLFQKFLKTTWRDETSSLSNMTMMRRLEQKLHKHKSWDTEEAVKDDASYYFSYFVFYFSVDPTLWSGLNPRSVSSDIRI